MRITFIVLIILSAQTAVFPQAGFRKDYFSAPLDIEMYLSGNFGELRSDHFHAGIDIKTQGTRGLKVFAAAKGYVSRIKIESGGYGHTLYLTHPGGYTTVYAHLQRFRDDIAGYVRDKQYSSQKYEINLFPGRDEFPVEQGDLIAYSGTSGYSFGPHLHFEIRDAGNQVPMNALRFGLDIRDDTPPGIFSLYTYNDRGPAYYPLEGSRIPVRRDTGSYRLETGDTLEASGMTAFGIEAFDYMNGTRNRCGIYRIRMYLDGELTYEWTMDRFPFSQARYVNSYIDYEEKARNQVLVQKTFVDPNNRLDLYRQVENRGWYDFSQPLYHDIRILLEDAYGNRSELGFTVIGSEPEPGVPGPDDSASVFAWSEDNILDREDIYLKIPAGSLYGDIEFRWKIIGEGSCSPEYSIGDPFVPVQSEMELAILPVRLSESLRDKAYIAMTDMEGEKSPAGGEYSDGMIRTGIRDFGVYSVEVDTTEPTIKSLDLPRDGDDGEVSLIRFRVLDKASGLKSYEGYIDNDWALFEYDAKNDLVLYRIDPERLNPDTNHELELYIIDNKENIAYYYAEFYW